MKPVQIIEKLKEQLLKNPLVLGFVLVGSYARKKIYSATEYSDAEGYIVVVGKDVAVIENQLPQLVQPLGKVLFSYKNQWAGFSTVFENLFRLELPIAKITELESVFSRPTAQEVKVLIDKTDGLLKRALDKRPEKIDFEKLFQSKAIDFWYMLIVGAQYFKKGEIWNARSVLQVLQSSLIKMFELLNNPEILLLETNKRVELFLTKEQVKLLQKVSPAYQKEDIYKALIQIAAIFPQVLKQIEDKYHFVYDKKIETAVKPRLLEFLNG